MNTIMHVNQLSIPSGNANMDGLAAECTTQVKGMVQEPSTYTLTTTLSNPKGLSMTDLSNQWRLQQAAADPLFFHIDHDAKMIRWPDFPLTGKPYFVKAQLGNAISSFAFFVNGCADFFAQLLLELKSTPDIEVLVNRHRSEVFSFPAECVKHYAFSRARGCTQYIIGNAGMRQVNGVWQLA